MKIINKYDHFVFQWDIMNFLNSKFARGRKVIIDKRLDESGFVLPETRDLGHFPTDVCLSFLRNETDKHICLTIGTSYRFPSIGDRYWIHYLAGQFPYPALIGLKGVRLAEIHCSVSNFDEHREIGKYYRISIYEVDGVQKTRTRLARFENGEEIDEDNLEPGEDLDDVLHFSHFDGPGAYKYALEAEGVGFGITCCWGVSKTMEKHNLSFPDAMRILNNNGALINVGEGKTFPSFVKYGT